MTQTDTNQMQNASRTQTATGSDLSTASASATVTASSTFPMTGTSVSVSGSSSAESSASWSPSFSPLLLSVVSSTPYQSENVSLGSDPHGEGIAPLTLGIIVGGCALAALLIASVVAMFCMQSRRRGGCCEDVVNISEGGTDDCAAREAHNDVLACSAVPAAGRDTAAVPAALVPDYDQMPATPFSTVSKEDEMRTGSMAASVHVEISTPHHIASAALPGPLRSDVDANPDTQLGPGTVLHTTDAQAYRSSVRVIPVCSVPSGPAAARDSLSDSGGPSLHQRAAPSASSAHPDALDGEVLKKSAAATVPSRTATRLQPERRSSFDAAASRIESYARDLPLTRRRASTANLAAASLLMAGAASGSTGRDFGDPAPPLTSGRIPGQA